MQQLRAHLAVSRAGTHVAQVCAGKLAITDPATGAVVRRTFVHTDGKIAIAALRAMVDWLVGPGLLQSLVQ